jgi:putative nucleotidyltransferase with HDIG domain
MRLKFSSEKLSLFHLIRSELTSDQAIYLVGGAVRDALLGVENHDLDFVLPANPTTIAKQLAKRLKAGFYVLDDDRHTARVLYRSNSDIEIPLDFVQFTGNSLHEDLSNRDFTINAMAVSLADLEAVIDPLDGQSDLDNKVIRTCGPYALLDDPVRILRGVRLAHQFNFNYAEDLEELMVEASKHLAETSSERQRDELFKILEGPEPHSAIEDCQRFHVIESTFPNLKAQLEIPASPPHIYPLFQHTLQSIKYFDEIIRSLQFDEMLDDLDIPCYSSLFAVLSPFSAKLREYLLEEITPGRHKFALGLLGALLHDIGKPETKIVGDDGRYHYFGHDNIGAELAWEAARRIQLSIAESKWVAKFVESHMGLLSWTHSEEMPTRRSIYRFFKKVGDAGIAIALFSLADSLATYGEDISAKKWEKHLGIVGILLTNWWENQEIVVSPRPFFDGHDLQKEFGLKPGKMIGVLLSDLIEAQASGDVKTKEEARSFITGKIANK